MPEVLVHRTLDAVALPVFAGSRRARSAERGLDHDSRGPVGTRRSQLGRQGAIRRDHYRVMKAGKHSAERTDAGVGISTRGAIQEIRVTDGADELFVAVDEATVYQH